MIRVFKITVTRNGKRCKSDCYYGKVKLGPGQWSSKHRLYGDKTASERRLKELQTEADQRHSGVRTAELDQLALPINDLIDRYCASLEAQRMDYEHVRIGQWMLTELAKRAG